MTEENPFSKNKWEIYWNLINSGIIAGAVIIGGLTTGRLTTETLGASFLSGLLVFISQFKQYWQSQQGEYKPKLLGFL